MKLIERTSYLDQLKTVMGTPDIKVITGVRRSGKSKLMDAFIEHIEKTIENKNIIRVKLNLKKFEFLKNGDSLYKFIDENYVEDTTNFLFIDEVQL